MSCSVISQCPVCSNDNNSCILNHIYDDRYGYPGEYSLCKCNECGHVFLDAVFTNLQLTNLYSRYYPRSRFDLSQYRPHQEDAGFLAWLDGINSSAYRHVPKNCRILDIGCGFGETLGYHKARGCDVYGVEADKNIMRVADKYGFKVEVGLFDPENYPEAFFDYITMDQVMEHVQNPLEMFGGIARILKKGGFLILSIPNVQGLGRRIFGRRWIHWHVPYHMQFYSDHSMQLLSEKAGLVLDQTKTVTPSSWLYFQWLHLVTFPKNGVASVFWSHNGKYGILQKIGVKLFTQLHTIRINHVITRIFDGFDLGDNRLYFFRKP
jgi:2-polyprenyl-3-methyl-5-hydroxy-6-metoxy-1,4-benzoquinol methylase